jgi:hypothetical protein
MRPSSSFPFFGQSSLISNAIYLNASSIKVFDFTKVFRRIRSISYTFCSSVRLFEREEFKDVVVLISIISDIFEFSAFIIL